MTNRGLAVLGIRLFALFIALQALFSLLQSDFGGQQLVPAAEPINGTSTLLGVLLCLMVAGLLWVCVGRIADWVLPTRRGHSLALGDAVTVSDAQIIAYSAVGLYLMADSLPGILLTFWPLLLNYAQLDGSPEQLSLAAAGIRFTLGLMLFFGGRGLAGLVRQLRRAPAR
ncbi:MAG: hypothetical protein J5I81_07965 [Nitrococcus mobilis]|nr:hypothetical protein [Nitrococcus mobilis]